jgi:hypothetical protein
VGVAPSGVVTVMVPGEGVAARVRRFLRGLTGRSPRVTRDRSGITLEAVLGPSQVGALRRFWESEVVPGRGVGHSGRG